MLVPAASAHVTVNPNEVPAGSFSRFAVRVPTERPNADTTKVVLQLPEGLAFVSFQPKPGWTRTVTMVKLAKPVTNDEGETVTERIGTVTWEGGKIAPGEFDEFGLSAKVPDTAGQTLVFPAVQTYSERRGRPLDRRRRLPIRPRRESRWLPRRRRLRLRPRPTTTAASSEDDDGGERDTFTFIIAIAALVACRGRPGPRAEAEIGMSLRVGAAVLLAALVACPAAAGHGNGAARGYTSTITTVTPKLDGLTVQVLQGDDQLELRNDTGQRLVIEGYDGEPYLRFDGGGGVFRNANSPATYLNEERYGGVDVPTTASKSATPHWERVSRGTCVRTGTTTASTG